MNRALGSETLGQVLPLGPIVKESKDTADHLPRIGRWVSTLRVPAGLGNPFHKLIQLLFREFQYHVLSYAQLNKNILG